MNKQGMELTSAITWLVIFVVSAAILLWFLFSVGKDTSNVGTLDSVQSWVAAQSKVYQLETGKEYAARKALDIGTRPPAPELQEPLEITKKEQLVVQNNAPAEATKKIAESMVDCWNAFGRGELPFKADNSDVFCYSCRAIWIDQSLRQEQLGSFKASLTSEPIDPFQDQTYVEYLSNINPEYGLLLPEILPLKQDLFIYFVALYGEQEAQRIRNMLQAKMQAPAQETEGLGTLATVMAFGAGLFFGGANPQTGITAVNIAQYLTQEKPFYPFILVGDAEMIKTVCTPEGEEVA